MPKIAILGAGGYGTALGGILAKNGYDLDYYDPMQEKERLSKVVDGAKAMILCVPSGVATRLVPHLPGYVPLIVATKGFLSDKYFVKFEKWAVLSGPGFAENIKAGGETFLTVTDKKVAKLLASDFVRFDVTDDRLGVLMCGALKNVYAILAGRLGLVPGTAAMRNFIEDVSLEMGLVLKENGASQSTIYQACGIGDLILTCSPESRNYNFGRNLRKNPNYKPECTVEGLTTLKRIRQGEIKVPAAAQYLRRLIKDSAK